jgi:hypothetical protein
MASTISNPQIGTFKRIKMQYVAVAGSVALAAVAIVGAVTLTGDGPASTARSAAPAANIDASTSYPLVQEMSHPQVALPITVSDVEAGFSPAVQEQSHPVAVQTSRTSDVQVGSFPAVQELSHPVLPAPESRQLTAEELQFGSFPTVQELSHPVIPAASPSDSTTDNGSYPLVQELSHPR